MNCAQRLPQESKKTQDRKIHAEGISLPVKIKTIVGRKGDIIMEYTKRKKPRLKNYDYTTAGAYFITICTHERQQILCQISDDAEIQLTNIGIIADKYINLISDYYENIMVDSYVIMPDHIHLMISITRRAESARPTGISRLIGGLKRLIHREIGKNIFQTSFYDHIIRDMKDYEMRINYIKNNPQKWIEQKSTNKIVGRADLGAP